MSEFTDKKKLIKMIGEGLLYASINVSLASCEMSSKYSVRNFSKDQETLQSACDALTDYILISSFWTIGVSMLLYAKYGVWGIIAGLLSNVLVTAWMYFSYIHAFKTAVKKYGLKMPKVNFMHWSLADSVTPPQQTPCPSYQ